MAVGICHDVVALVCTGGFGFNSSDYHLVTGSGLFSESLCDLSFSAE
ncbi:MAG: hypothetical protein IJI68_05455 [Eggerthellaceae bacterium]|nr:hypothetical protein [Eggerthellaceae bacterium]